MKYRLLLLLVLISAILVATIGGTLASYTGDAAFSFSIQPDTTEQDTQAAEAETQADTESVPSSPQEASSDTAPDALSEYE